jgi:hypothetical protein
MYFCECKCRGVLSSEWVETPHVQIEPTITESWEFARRPHARFRCLACGAENKYVVKS